MKKLRGRPLMGLALVGLGMALFVVPKDQSGPLLFKVTHGHGLHVLDAIGLMPFVAGLVLITTAILAHRLEFKDLCMEHPMWAAATLISGGLGVGLIVPAIVPFITWWVLGMVLLGVTLVAIVFAAGSASR